MTLKPLTPAERRARRNTGPPWEEILARLRRIESKIVQLMKHQGMTTDGRKPLDEDHHTD